MKLKKVLLVIIALIIVGALFFALISNGNKKKKDSSKIQVVATTFASYDFLRAIVGDSSNVELTFLLGPGKDMHSYDPTAQDLITIQNADLFVYVGGEAESWTEKVLEAQDTKIKTLCIADYVDKLDEEEIDGAEEHEHDHDDHDHDDHDEHDDKNKEHEEHDHEHEEGAFDEHIWTSPANAIKMVKILEKNMEDIDSANAEKYKKNAEDYIAKINDVDKKIKEIVDNKVRNRLIFADKMPMQYFIKYYGLNVSAAFSGCSTETEPSASTIAYLEKVAKEEKIPVILYIELNPGKVAKTIADEVGNGCVPMQIQTLHNVSLDDFNNGETWVSLMNKNVDVLKKALQ